MNAATQLSSTKQIIVTVAIATIAFLAALPIGASIMSDSAANAASVSDLACKASTAPTKVKKSVSSTNTTTNTNTHTHTDTQTSSNNSGSTAQVGHDGVATAVTVGDILSNNDVNVPVLSNNTTTVSPTVSLLSGNSLLNGDGNSLLGDLGLGL